MGCAVTGSVTIHGLGGATWELPVGVLQEVITVEKVVGSVRTIYSGSIGSLIALGVLTPPEV